MTRWRFASSPATSIRITTRSPRFASAFSADRVVVCRVLKLAHDGELKLGTVDWMARRSTPMRAGTAHCPTPRQEIEKQLKKEVQQLLRLAERADPPTSPTGCRFLRSLKDGNCVWRPSPKRSEDRARAQERLEREQGEHQAKLPRARSTKTHRKEAARPPARAPTGGVQEKDQINLTDDDSRIMKVPAVGSISLQRPGSRGHGHLLIVANEVTQAANDKKQLVPMIEKSKRCRKNWSYQRMLADNGISVRPTEQCVAPDRPLISMGVSAIMSAGDSVMPQLPNLRRLRHTDAENAHRLKTPAGRKLYALRKQTPEPVRHHQSAMGSVNSLARPRHVKASGIW